MNLIPMWPIFGDV
jgi:hypothetical protein